MKIGSQSAIEFKLVLVLSEIETRALDALVGYNFDDFVRVFYEKMGHSYMKPNEEGLRALFETVREIVPQKLARLDRARQAFLDESRPVARYALPPPPEGCEWEMGGWMGPTKEAPWPKLIPIKHTT